MLPMSMPSALAVNGVGDPPSTNAGGGTVYLKTVTGSMTPTGTLQVRNRGRIFGRPGIVVMDLQLPGTVSIRIRRD